MEDKNVISSWGAMGYAEATVKWQGNRGWCKEVYTDMEKFNDDWKTINGYWEEAKKDKGFRKPLTPEEKQIVDELIARLARARGTFYD